MSWLVGAIEGGVSYQWQANMPHIVPVLLWLCVGSG